MSKNREVKQVAIDADFLIFRVCEGKFTTGKVFGKKENAEKLGVKEYKEPLAPYKKDFENRITQLMNEIAVRTVSEPWILSDTPLIVFSDPTGNFRNDIYPEYKGNRKPSERSALFYRLRKWAVKNHTFVKRTEADDIVSFLVRVKNYLGVTFDKDMLYGVEGLWYNPHHMHQCLVNTNQYEAERFTMQQTLGGDPVDNIKGIPNVALTTARKLLDEHGWDWKGIVKAYESRGLTEDDAILTRRLVCMRQIKETKKGKLKIKMFTPCT